ncbi:MarR family transcriptional regulator [Achromobacter sp. GG226]|uniref:MarR family transcriptional regulator n=1 Tax=Verticiella alkaliphila TaxID=2779529 RepID=UPI001C0E5E48|nr:MarR family transcriptional regulator [Verticiella sp. GG226]MBU4611856.1 MarR family transcriptional regulator [Verticiella sp. GG226]
MLELEFHPPVAEARESASPAWEAATPLVSRLRLAEVVETLARCAALYGTLHAEEMGRLLHVSSTDVRLLTLLAHSGPLGVSRLAELAPGSPGGTDAAIERLVECGFVTRQRGHTDRRTVRLQADASRSAMVTRPPTATLLALTAAMEGLPAGVLEQACDVLSRLDAALTARVRDTNR